MGEKMTEKRFTNIEHDYENAWIKCNDDGDFMIYAIYKELDEGLPSLEDLLNGLSEENKQLEKENKELKQFIGVIYDLIDGYIAIADKYRKPIKSLTIGDDLGYWNGVYQYMKKLRERIGVL